MTFLSELIDWQQINSEAIQGSRPWKVFGEGPSIHAPKIASYQLSRLKFDSSDFRFTAKGDALYAIALGWPADGKFVITSLADGSGNYPRQIGKVELLGAQSNLKWSRGPQGLEILAPDTPPCKYAYTFRILSA
jgi:alpha-L-fucosidase